MFKVIVIPVVLFLFVLQTSSSLFANEGAEAKPAESAVTAEAKAEEGTAAVAEVKETAEAAVEEKVEAVAEKVAEVVESTEAVAEVVEAAETAVEKKVEADAEKAVEAEESAEAVIEEKAEAVESTEAVAVTETDVIATVNGEEIIRKDFDRRLNVFRRMNQDITRDVEMQIVNQLTKKMLLKQFVEKQGIVANEEEIKEELEKIKFFLQNNPANKDKPLDEILETQGSNITELEEEVSRALALSKYLESTVTDEDKRSYFDANKDAFNGSKVKASHVLIDTRNMKTDAEREEAKRIIESVKIKIDKGADFAEMAKEYSNCPSAEKGGDIGFFQRKGSIVEEFAKVAFAMEVGEVSDPVETQFGYHIIKVTEKEEGKDVSYEDVTDMVDFVFMQIKTENLLKELYAKADIKVML